LSSVIAQAGTNISQGDLIGYTGASASNFEHLHFEIREANASDPYSSWQRDTINPLKYLNYTTQDKNNISVTIDSVSVLNSKLKVATTIKVPIDELDLMRVEVEVYKKESNGRLTLKERNYSALPPTNKGNFPRNKSSKATEEETSCLRQVDR
jgi:murein DD-endopeptidase MepM/ murein hydrolase activator NlpD